MGTVSVGDSLGPCKRIPWPFYARRRAMRPTTGRLVDAVMMAGGNKSRCGPRSDVSSSPSHSSSCPGQAYSRIPNQELNTSASLRGESQRRDRVRLGVTHPNPKLTVLAGERRKHSNPLGMLPSRLPDLPPEIWEYILLFVPEPAINDLKLVSCFFHAGWRKRGGKTKDPNLFLRLTVNCGS